MMMNRKNLRVALARQGRSLKEISRSTGIDLLRLYRITGKNVRPRQDELDRIALALDIDVADLEAEGP